MFELFSNYFTMFQIATEPRNKKNIIFRYPDLKNQEISVSEDIT